MPKEKEPTTSRTTLRMRQRETLTGNLAHLIALENATFNGDGAEEFDLTELEGHHANSVWREKVTQWCYDVVDHLNESRSIVYVAMNILDRFTAKQEPDTTMSDRNFELASLSALFLAVRISGSGNLRLSQLLAMSRSAFTSKNIIDMGTRMIKTLSWNFRLVTPFEFVKAMCAELPPCLDDSMKQALLESATFFVEISVLDIGLASRRASHTALAALLNALNENRSLSLAQFNQSVEAVTMQVAESREVTETRIRLREIFNQSSESNQVASPHLILDDDDSTSIPTVVSEESLPSLEQHSMPSENKMKRVAHTYFDQPICKRHKSES